MRLFVAIYPDAATRAWLAEVQRRLRKELPRFGRELRWISPEDIHVTLAFLGEEQEDDAISKALETCSYAPIELTVGGLGVFPTPRRPSVLWTGVVDSTGALSQLQAEITATLASFVEPERRPFEPHLTLARIKPWRHSRVGEAIASLAAKWGNSPPPWRVEGFALMESRLSSAGARHLVVREYRMSTGS